MQLSQLPESSYDERSNFALWGDSTYRSSWYKMEKGKASYGSFTTADGADYFMITPGVGSYSLYVTTDMGGGVVPSANNGSFSVSITDANGNVLLGSTVYSGDSYTRTISFNTSSPGNYYVSITNTSQQAFDYVAALVANSESAPAADTVKPAAPLLVTDGNFTVEVEPQVALRTSLGNILVELNSRQAPVTVANILSYVHDGYYNGTIFHRVISSFMVQGGGFTADMVQKAPTYAPIPLETTALTGLSNVRGTLAMARTNVPDSATSQFFINVVNNTGLDYANTDSPGYTVFGKVLTGMDVVDKIRYVGTHTEGYFNDVPVTDVLINSAAETQAGLSVSRTGKISVKGIETGAAWEYSRDGGAHWLAGSGSSFVLPAGIYGENAIQIRQTDAAGNKSAVANKSTSILIVNAGLIQGTVNADTLTGGVSNDMMVSGTGNDILNGGAGADTLMGGPGNDTYTVDNGLDKVFETTLPTNTVDYGGVDLVKSSVTWTLGNYLENLTLTGSAVINGIGNSLANRINGNGAANVLKGLAGNDSIVASAGNDTLDGGSGNDLLDGGTGADSLVGGAGNDTYLVDNIGDKILEGVVTATGTTDAGGVDLVKASVNWILGSYVENLQLTGTGAITGTGNGLGNRLTGNAVANTLNGAGGNDTLDGGSGSDTLSGGTGADAFLFSTTPNAAANKDVITDFKAGGYADKIYLDDDIFKALGTVTSNTPLNSGAFYSGSGDFLASHRIIYDQATGTLSYDADGNGAGAAVQFAVVGVGSHPVLAAADFMVVP